MGYTTTNIHGAKRVTAFVTHYPANSARTEFWDVTFTAYDETNTIASFTVFFNVEPVDLIRLHGVNTESNLFNSNK